MPADDEWMYKTEELRGRVFRDCTKPGVLSYGLTIIPLLFQSATRTLALTALGGAVALTRKKQELIEGGEDSPPSSEAPVITDLSVSASVGRRRGEVRRGEAGDKEGPRDSGSTL